MTLPTPSDPSAASDRDVVRLARQGKEAGYRELVRRYRRKVLNAVYRIVRHRDRAEDLTQETFVKAFDALDRYDSERIFAAWITTIARNSARDYMGVDRPDRPDAAWTVTPGYLDEAGIAATGPSPTSRPEPDLTDSGAALRRAMKRLPTKYRRCVMLRYRENRSYEEIAAIMGVPVGTVGTYLNRAREQLRQRLGY